MKKFIVVLIMMSVACVEPAGLYAAGVVINEIVIEPQQSVEVYNGGNEETDISGWYVDDGGGSTYYTIADGTVLPPGQCVVLTSSFSFNKSTADTARLFNDIAAPTDSAAVLVDSYTYFASPGADRSYQRIPDGENLWATSSASLGFRNLDGTSCIPVPTVTATPPVTPTSVPVTDVDTPVRNIFITESGVNPFSGTTEWVELYNNNDFAVTLDGWFIDDIRSGGGQKVEFSRTIGPQSYTILDLEAALFNNNGDEINLMNSDGEIIDAVSYESSVKGMTVGKVSLTDVSACVMQPTQALPNTPCAVVSPTGTPVQSAISPTKPAPTNTPAAVTNAVPGVAGVNTVSARTTKAPTPSPAAASSNTYTLGGGTSTAPGIARTLSFSSLSASILTIISLLFKMRGE